MQANEVSVAHAIQQAASSADELVSIAAKHRASHPGIDQYQTLRQWQPTASTYCYLTHMAISGQSRERLEWLAEVFFNAATLARQPWYPQFGKGRIQALREMPDEGIEQHQLGWACFDLGLPAPRYYRQLLSLARAEQNTAVIVARSVNEGPPLPEDAKLAFTLDPNGEVLHWENDCLHWHHICCTPGAAILPKRLDRYLINGLRRLGLDQAERKTYRQEAEQLRDWLQGSDPSRDIRFAD